MAPGPRPHEPDGVRRRHTLQIDHRPVIQNGNLRRLARRIPQRNKVRARDFTQIQIGGDDVAEHETLEAELIFAARLGDEARGLERGQQAKCRRARNPGACRELAQRQAALVEREGAEQFERLRGRIDSVPAETGQRHGPFHWMKRYIAQ
jgi:hypothetical protein